MSRLAAPLMKFIVHLPWMRFKVRRDLGDVGVDEAAQVTQELEVVDSGKLGEFVEVFALR